MQLVQLLTVTVDSTPCSWCFVLLISVSSFPFLHIHHSFWTLKSINEVKFHCEQEKHEGMSCNRELNSYLGTTALFWQCE